MSLQNNQFKALENLSDTENPKELGNVPGRHPIKDSDCTHVEPIVSPKEDEKEDESVEEEGEDVWETEKEDGGDGEET